jgi:hypothetical protein
VVPFPVWKSGLYDTKLSYRKPRGKYTNKCDELTGSIKPKAIFDHALFLLAPRVPFPGRAAVFPARCFWLVAGGFFFVASSVAMLRLSASIRLMTFFGCGRSGSRFCGMPACLLFRRSTSAVS